MTTHYARSFKELRVYQKAREVSKEVFRRSKAFPKEGDQFRRAARSVGAQIAEAWGKRRYAKHFVSKLSDADAEQMETQHWVGEALRLSHCIGSKAIEFRPGRHRTDVEFDDGKSRLLLWHTDHFI
jgi:four helix bundle protein